MKHGHLAKSNSGTLKREKIRKDDVYRGEIEATAHLTPEQYVVHILKRNTDTAALNTFFLVFRRYISPEQLLERIHKEFIEAVNKKSYRERLANIAATWARDYYQEDFAHSDLGMRLFDLRTTMIGVRFV